MVKKESSFLKLHVYVHVPFFYQFYTFGGNIAVYIMHHSYNNICTLGLCLAPVDIYMYIVFLESTF